MARLDFSTPQDYKPGYSTTVLLAALVTIFAAEFILMLILHALPAVPPLGEAALDALLLTMLMFPLLRHYLKVQARRRQEVAALFEGVKAVLKYREFIDSARAIFESCKTTLGATAGYVALLSPDGKENEVLFLESGGRECAVDPSLPMPIRGLRAESYASGRAVYENDFSGSQWAGYMPSGHVTLDNVLFAPLLVEGKAVGLLGVANKPGGFTDTDARLAEAYGEMAAIALVNSRTMAMLENSEMRYRSVVQSAFEAIITIDAGGNIAFWNRRAEEMFGYTAAEIVGKPLMTIIPERYRQAHREGLARVAAGASSRVIGRTIEVAALTKGGEEIPVELSIAAWRAKTETFFTGILHDISERKRAEAALRDSHEQLEQRVEERTAALARSNRELEGEIVERRKAEKERTRLITAINQSAEMVVISRPDGVVQYVNPAYERFTGFTKEEAIGRHSILPADMQRMDTRKEIWETVSAGKVWMGDILNHKKDGTRYEEHATFSPVFDANGNIINIVAIKRDTTYEFMLRRARDYFTTVTSHELRTPITKLQLVTALLKNLASGPDADQIGPLVKVLEDSYDALYRVMAATTMFADLNRPKGERNLGTVYLHLDMVMCLGNARRFLELERHDIRLEADIESLPKDIEVAGNEEMVSSALDNVISNAIKYSPAGKAIRVTGKVRDGNAVIEIHDEGVGISLDEKEHVFDPYFSPEDPLHHTSRPDAYAGGGLGLGLTITRMIMEYHGGSLAIASEGEGMGTTVSLSFPLKHPAAAKAAA